MTAIVMTGGTSVLGGLAATRMAASGARLLVSARGSGPAPGTGRSSLTSSGSGPCPAPRWDA
ncbi:hypothetical protein ACTMTF_31955 [Nonomuraea sp. ZG12]|uniref:hypothetical protein n=1 Tax=Nonomuraea sp. ZG12 TaxID=3452207 RepID=UPI003F8C46FF